MTDKMQIKISIVMPVYNAEQYLLDTLNNILQQSVNEIEVICIDDGSTDHSLQILKDFANRSEKLRIVQQKNQGAGIARNRGIAEARGQYVAFMDADDKYPHANVLELLYTKAMQSGMDIVGGSFSEFHEGYYNDSYSGIAMGYQFLKEEVQNYQDYQFDYGYHRFIYKRKCLIKNKIEFPTYIRFQDPPFFVKAMLASKQFYVVPEVTYCYRISYKTIAWTDKQVNDLLAGLLENLELAKMNGLKKLYWITLKRIQGEYQDILISACYQQNTEIKQLFIKLKSSIVKDWLVTIDVYLYFDMKHIIRTAIKNCDKRTNRKPISKRTNIKKLFNGSYLDLNGYKFLLKQAIRKMKSRCKI